MTRVTDPWLTSSAAQAVCALLTDAGHQAWFVGGCVRNALLGEPLSDLDISTDARPERVMALAEAAGVKAVPTGIDHGTVTLVVEDTAFEVTTFRRDVETDGRRAVVAFADTLEEDAQRRDFTMNALYADASGVVTDPVGGIADLEARHFRFIGSAEERIKEDYLRILRFFRFFAWYGVDLDAEGLAACAAHADGIAGLSAERVTAELIKLLSAPDPLRGVAAMEQSGVLAQALPGASAKLLGPYLHLDPVSEIEPVSRLSAISGDISTLRLSKAQGRAYETYREAMESVESAGALGYHYGEAVALRALALRAAALEQPLSGADIAAARVGATAEFPVKAKDLPEHLEGPAIGAALKQLEATWIAQGFAPDRDTLLASL
ncbi:MAG: CCA tRNA nucleotidyltransferase [Pseudomonadota bacterium]